MTDTAGLIGFLNARLNEDVEAVVDLWLPAELMGTVADTKRVLLEVDAKRLKLAICEQILNDPSMPDAARALAMTVLQFDAHPYSTHPDYREEWRIPTSAPRP